MSEPTLRERLAKIEANTAWIKGSLEHVQHAQREKHAEQDNRIKVVEQQVAKNSTHFRWLYGIWAAVLAVGGIFYSRH